MELKKTRRTFNPVSNPFKSIYTFDGRVFIKMNDSNNPESQNIRNNDQLNELLNRLKTNETGAASASSASGATSTAATSLGSSASGSSSAQQ